ncbi:unnamed protein product [Staurois parvus]|uniref:Uncharacterized protein n=1 Tax=Staurois parvus TaxID=386267 RepID=A0ABN9BY23_9NEOB|nr:unnamed protein product [Staurois parvus]
MRSGESGYSECGSWGERISEWRGSGRADIVNAGLRRTIVNAGEGRADIVNAGSGESGYSECGVRERIYECRVRGDQMIVNAVWGERI